MQRTLDPESADRRAELLEQYVALLPEDQPATVQTFAQQNARLIAVADELKASWRKELQGSGTVRAQHVTARRAIQSSRPALRIPIQWYAAAGTATVALIAIGMYMISGRSALNPANSPVTTYSTLPGQRATVTLADGSTAVLGVATTLQVPENFGRTSRSVKVNGQVLFTVAHKQSLPFSVQTQEATVEVLGTQFSVRRYATDSATNVVVSEGRIGVGRAVLNAQESAVVTPRSLNISRGVDVASALSWSTGTLILNNETLEDVIPEFERWFGVEVQVVNPGLLQQQITGRFPAMSAKEAIAQLALALNARVAYSGNRATFDVNQ